MDIFASFFAYLGTLAAIGLAIAMSYDAFAYAPLHPTAPPQMVSLAAKPSATEEAAKPIVSVAHESPSAARRGRREMTDKSAAQMDETARIKTARVRTLLTRRRVTHRMQSPQRLGYAQEPRNMFDAGPFR